MDARFGVSAFLGRDFFPRPSLSRLHVHEELTGVRRIVCLGKFYVFMVMRSSGATLECIDSYW
jgi:hypothetical protein